MNKYEYSIPYNPILKKHFFIIVACVVLTILACRIPNFSVPSEITSTLTPSLTTAPSETPTLVPAQTPTPVKTPTLGLNRDWRKSRIAFASNRDGRFQIYLMRPDGSEVTQFTTSIGDNFAPSWSLDARKIAFVSTRDGNSEIYVMNSDGTEQTNITLDASNDYMPIWMPKAE